MSSIKNRKSRKELSTPAFLILSYVIIFLALCFVLTCSFMLFFIGLEIPHDTLKERAPATFLNIFILTLIFTIIILLLKYFFIDLNIQKLIDATSQVKKGNYSARIYASDHPLNAKFNRVYDNFNSMTETLQSTESLQMDFISNVSHEMKTPLAAIQNYASLLQTPGISEEQKKEFAEAVTENTKRMNLLITNILKLNKLDNQTEKPEYKTFDLSESVAECLIGFESLWTEKNLDVNFQLEENVIVYSDKNLLELVWNNLISNAIKFSHENGKLIVCCRTVGHNAEVLVTDTGCGISAETGKHIFDKFYQGDTSHKTQGNGLGLALVKKVIDILGGKISVESEIGKGSTFKISIESSKGGKNEFNK